MATLETNALAQSINFVTKFESDLHNLLALLGKTDVEKVAPGTAFTVYETTGSLSSATVAEKAEIPDSGYATGNGVVKTVTYKKYRNLHEHSIICSRNSLVNCHTYKVRTQK